MFATGISALYFLTLLVKMVLGAVALTLACLWTPQQGKRLFCVFIGFAFVASPILEGAAYVIVMSASYQASFPGGFQTGSHDSYRFSLMLAQFAEFLFNCVSVVLLVSYAAVRYQRKDLAISQQATDPSEPSALLLGKCWDTHLPAGQLVEIARRREWAHAIDCLPAILFFWLFIWAYGEAFSESGRPRGELIDMIWVLGAVGATLFLTYLLMKDSIGGVSVGKWFTSCRVVDAATGVPASVPQTMLRNAIFLLFPLGSVIEVVMTNFRPDRKRLGDLWAGTMVVHGPAQIVDGERLEAFDGAAQEVEVPIKHPLDD